MNNVISTTIRLYRNLADYKFVPKLEQEKKGEIIDRLSSALKGKFQYINLKQADDKTIESLNNAGIEFATPHIFVDKDRRVSIALFDGEHMTIRVRGLGFNKELFKDIQNVINILNDKITLLYNDEYGYLMSDVSRIGTGLEINADMCLPNLKNIDKIEQVQQNVRKLRYKLSEVGGDTFKLSTICNLGLTEKEIISEFEKMLSKIEDLEIESVKLLDVEKHDEIVDQIERCIGILNSAHLMSVRELRGHISTLRTARNLGFTDLSIDMINELQALTKHKNEEFITKNELITLAKKTKEIIKGV